MGKYRKQAVNRLTRIYEQARWAYIDEACKTASKESYAIWWINLVSLFQFWFVNGQFKDYWVIYGFHQRIVAKTLTISLKIEKIVCDCAEIDYTGQYKNNGIK